MARSIDTNDPLDRIGDLIDFRCGMCKSARVAAMATITQDGRKGIEFRCHGESEFLELSDAQIRSPRRLKGYRPFSGLQQAQEARKKGSGGAIDIQNWAAQRIDLSRLPELFQGWKPTCGKCNKPVKRVDCFRNELGRRDNLKFYCHGDTEVIALPDERGLNVGFLKRYRPFMPERPSNDLAPFIEELLQGVVSGSMTPSQVSVAMAELGATTAAVDFNNAQLGEPWSPEPAKPKPEPDLLIPSVQPRVIRFED